MGDLNELHSLWALSVGALSMEFFYLLQPKETISLTGLFE